MLASELVAKLYAQGMNDQEMLAEFRRVEESGGLRSYRGSRPYRPQDKPYQRRHDFYGPIVPRLPDREWWPLRWEIIARDGEVCAYCEETTGPWCVDHIVPLSRGGSNGRHNLTACCTPCNSSKADRLLSEWEGRHVY